MTPIAAPSALTAAPPPPADPTDPSFPARVRDCVLESLHDDKAEDTVVVDLQGRSSLADYLVISSGRSTRQVGAMADHILRRMKDLGVKGADAEGMPQNDWVLIDAGDVIVHLFRPEVRAFYGLEKLWGVEPPAPRTEPTPTPPSGRAGVPGSAAALPA